MIERYAKALEFKAIVPVSALTGENVDALEREILAALPEGEPLYPDDYLTDQTERTLASELVREKVLAHMRDELPFTTAVVIDQFEEAPEAGRADEDLRVDPGRSRIAEADRRGQGRRHDQAHRHRGSQGSRGDAGRQGLSRSARQGP